MSFSKTASRPLIHAALIPLAWAGAAQAQSLDDQKKQLEIEQAELNKQKTMMEIIKGPAQTTAGSATVTAPELSAEGLMLSRHVQERTAQLIVTKLGSGTGTEPISVVFGDQPATTADYLALKHGAAMLQANLQRAADLARSYYEGPEPVDPGSMEPAAVLGGLPLALSAVTTVASLLRVNTTVTGIALPTPNEQYRAVLMQELRRHGWKVDPPRSIISSTGYADALLAGMQQDRDAAASFYSKYVAHLAQKDGKPANLPEGEVIVGKTLETALNDYAALQKALFTPVNGILPAIVIEEQKQLADSAAMRRILYIQHHKGALTSITRQGTFTGIFSVPAHVSASHVVEFAFRTPGGTGDQYDMVRYDTPLLRVTGVRTWLASAPPRNDQPKALAGAAAAKGTAASAYQR